MLDAVEQVALVCLPVLAHQGLAPGVSQVLDALLSAEVEFDPDPLVLRVDQAVGVATEAMHVAEGAGDAALAHDDRHLVERFGQQASRNPSCCRRSSCPCADRA